MSDSHDQVTTEIENTIRRVLKMENDRTFEGQDLRTLEGLDSIMVLRIITQLERKFGVELDETVVFNISSVSELAQKIHEASRQAS